MKKKLKGTFYDVLSKQDREYYMKYRTNDVQDPREVARFKALCIQKVRYDKDKKWAKLLAWRVVRDVEPLQIDLARNVLYAAMVWGRTH